jgi:gluconokinase
MVVVLMGVSGSGKTTVGRLVAARLGWTFLDADDLHPPTNVAKMEAGLPLDDEDRAPWLAAVRETIDRWRATGTDAVLACSALARRHREVLGDGLRFVLLEGSRELLQRRLEERTGHFMPATLLASQLAALEVPEDAIRVTVDRPPEALAEELAEAIGAG